jgi:hypothetical protein
MGYRMKMLAVMLLLTACARDGTVSGIPGSDTLVFNPGGKKDIPGNGSSDGRDDSADVLTDSADDSIHNPGDGGSDKGDSLNLSDALDGHPEDQVASDDISATDAGDVVETPEVTSIEVRDDPCLFIPEVGQFQPVLECYWDDPVESTKYDDVVMTPAVGNLTDDNFDGIVDLKDIPDIAFLTYRLEEGGCCKSNAVLRVVSGSCHSGLSGQGGAEQLLHEHYHITSPKLDNSSGLAIGDIDGDGLQDVVGMVNTTGTVAFTGVLYNDHPPLAISEPSPAWQVFGGLDAVTVLTPEEIDEAGIVVTNIPEIPLLFNWTWGQNSKAVASVAIIVWARAPLDTVQLQGVVSTGNNEFITEPQEVPEGDTFHRLVFPLLKNPFNDYKQWTDADLENLNFGFVHSGPQGVPIQITRVTINTGHVEQKWTSEHPKGNDIVTAAQPAIADLDKNGMPEIVIGRVVLDGATGNVVWKGTGHVGVNSFFGPISTAADLNLDNKLEVIAGGTLYDWQGNILWQIDYGNDGSGCKKDKLPCDGFNAVGDFDTDDFGEVVIVRSGVIYVVEHTGDIKVKITLPKDNCGFNEGGPPTVADFDGDDYPEIGVAGADFYVVFDLDCCDTLPACAAIPVGMTTCVHPGIRWKVPNNDCSSRVTGSSVFDFDGDGSAEVVYNDETKFRIFSGHDGTILFEKPNTSHTRLEYAVIADTDNDANAEIVIVENGYSNPDPTPLQVWGDAYDNWVPTRRIWNQHAYNITSITEAGLQPPGGETPNWFVYNNFRQNLPDYDPFLAPDLVGWVLDASDSKCPEHLVLRAQVCNAGKLWVPPHVHVTFFDAVSQMALNCASGGDTLVLLDSGECTVVKCAVTPPPGGAFDWKVKMCVDDFTFMCQGPGLLNECLEGNNGALGTVTGCQL